MSTDWRCEMRSNLEIFEKFIEHEMENTFWQSKERVYSHSAEYFFDAITGTLYKTPEEYKEWLLALLEAFRDAKFETIGSLFYTTVYQDTIKAYEKGLLEFLDYED